jgi:hypothetical protein
MGGFSVIEASEAGAHTGSNGAEMRKKLRARAG